MLVDIIELVHLNMVYFLLIVDSLVDSFCDQNVSGIDSQRF